MQPALQNELTDRLEISCPECGGVSSWKLLQSLNRCEYCGSALYRVYHENEPQYLVAESTVSTEPQIIDVLGTYDAMRVVSDRRAEFQSNQDETLLRLDLGSAFNDTEVYQVKDQRKQLFRVLEVHRLHVPYLLLCSTLVFHVLGRVSNASRKVYRSLFFTSEDVLPAYQQPWDFRDKGLVLSLQKLKAFDPEMQKASRFLAPVPTASLKNESPAELTRQRSLLLREIDPICVNASFVFLRRWIVFRPYAFVRAQTPQGIQWFLMDEQFGTIAGYPRTDELQRVQNNRLPGLQVTKNLILEVKAIPFRCPECGWDVEMDTRGIYQVCRNCTRLLETKETGLQTFNYRVLESTSWSASNSNSFAWLPFWRCRLRLNMEGSAYDDLSSLFKRLIPPSPLRPDSLPERWNAIFVPAFECWPYDRYDQWAFQTAIQLSISENNLPGETLLQGVELSHDEMIPPAYSAEMVRSLFPQILPFYLPAILQFQLNAMLVKRLSQMKVEFEDLEITYVPIPLLNTESEDARLAGPENTVEYKPLKTGQWAPALIHSVRRWRTMETENTSSSKRKWMRQ